MESSGATYSNFAIVVYVSQAIEGDYSSDKEVAGFFFFLDTFERGALVISFATANNP
jgi:hypothetical protein